VRSCGSGAVGQFVTTPATTAPLDNYQTPDHQCRAAALWKNLWTTSKPFRVVDV
jgi:hypothetical protein